MFLLQLTDNQMFVLLTHDGTVGTSTKEEEDVRTNNASEKHNLKF